MHEIANIIQSSSHECRAHTCAQERCSLVRTRRTPMHDDIGASSLLFCEHSWYGSWYGNLFFVRSRLRPLLGRFVASHSLQVPSTSISQFATRQPIAFERRTNAWNCKQNSIITARVPGTYLRSGTSHACSHACTSMLMICLLIHLSVSILYDCVLDMPRGWTCFYLW